MKTGLAVGERNIYNGGVSPLRRTRHAVYDLKYHFVWVPKYRKLLLTGPISKRLKEIFQDIAERYEFEIDTMEVMEDHVHLFLVVPPKYAPSMVVNILKSISAKLIFKEFPAIKRQLWGGELWNDGYFVRSVGDKVTADVICQYIKHQHREQLGFEF
jgi:REP-associated tyrosine transposase